MRHRGAAGGGGGRGRSGRGVSRRRWLRVCVGNGRGGETGVDGVLNILGVSDRLAAGGEAV